MQQIIRTTPRLHPLTAAAAVSVIAVSLAGVGVIAGVIPAGPGAHAAAAPVVTVPASTLASMPSADATPIARDPAATAAAEPAARPRRSTMAHATRVARTRDAEPAPAGPGEPVSYPYGSYGGYGHAPVQVTQAPVAIPDAPPTPAAAPVPAARPACGTCGIVEAVVESEKPGEASGVGMAGGALGGAVIGRQFGRGRGQDVLTVLGAIGGAVAGHQVEKQVRTVKVYEVRVRMGDGSARSVTQATPPSWRPGDPVRIEGGAISAGGNV